MKGSLGHIKHNHFPEMGCLKKRTMAEKQKTEAKRNLNKSLQILFLKWKYDCRCRMKVVCLCTIHYIAVKTKTPNAWFMESGKCVYKCVLRQFIIRLHWHLMWLGLLGNLKFVQQPLENTNGIKVFFPTFLLFTLFTLCNDLT